MSKKEYTMLEAIANSLDGCLAIMNKQIDEWCRGKDPNKCMEDIADWLSNHDGQDDEMLERLEQDGITETPYARKQVYSE